MGRYTSHLQTKCIRCDGKPYNGTGWRFSWWGLCGPCHSYQMSAQYRAYLVLRKAIRSGALPPAKECKCVDCGKQARDYDHRSYETPLKVAPVCRSCNQKRGPAKIRKVRPQVVLIEAPDCAAITLMSAA